MEKIITLKNWKGLNIKEIKKHKKELETLQDYVPLIILNHISAYKRFTYLKEQGLAKKIQKINYNKRTEFKNTSDKVKWIQTDVIEFTKKYPQYEVFVKTE